MVYFICCDFKASNNEVEYEALIVGMNMAYNLGAAGFQVKSDSILVFNKMTGEYGNHSRA